MNKILKEQLTKCHIAQIPEFDESDLTLTIPKLGTKSVFRGFLEENHTYLIEVEDYIITKIENFDLADKWNHGIIPKSKFLILEVSTIRGKMIQGTIKECNYDGVITGNTYTDFWLPQKSIRIRRMFN